MTRIELTAGPIDYDDTGGDGPVLVFIHGLTMDGTVWRKVVDRLGPGFRCITPTWPLGSHLAPMKDDADLSLPGMAVIIAEFLERLDLRDVILVQNDWGVAQIVVATQPTDRLAGLVLTSCEAFDNYPPGLPGKLLVAMAAVPGGFALLLQGMRFRVARRGPGAWGWMSKRAVPAEVMDRWFSPARVDPAIRRDLLRYCRSAPDKETLLAWAEQSRSFDRPVLIVWGTEDKIMPPEHGRRLADLYPDSQLIELDDTYTLIPEDRPDELADAIGAFVRTAIPN